MIFLGTAHTTTCGNRKILLFFRGLPSPNAKWSIWKSAGNKARNNQFRHPFRTVVILNETRRNMSTAKKIWIPLLEKSLAHKLLHWTMMLESLEVIGHPVEMRGYRVPCSGIWRDVLMLCRRHYHLGDVGDVSK